MQSIPRSKPTVTLVVEPRDELTNAIASDGKRLLLVSNREIFGTETGKPRTTVAKDQTGTAGICVRGDELWVSAYGHVLVSRDRGETLMRIDLEKDHPYYAIAHDAEGVWVAGHEGAVHLSTDGKTFARLKGGGKATFKCAVPSPFGMLLLTYNGRLYLGRRGKLNTTPLRAKSPLLGACVTASGAVVVVGHGDWKGAAFRTEDGKTFEPCELAVKGPVQGVVGMPDGRVIAGGQEDVLLVSYDDGKRFEELKHDFMGAKRNFGLFCQHDGAVYVTDSFQRMLRIE